MWRYRWVVALVILIVTGLAVTYAYSRPVSYEAAATILVRDPQAASVFELGQSESPDRYVANQAAFLRSNAVAERAREKLVATAPNAANGPMNVDVRWATNRDDIQVVVDSDQPGVAVAGANAIVDAYAELRAEAVAANFAAALTELEDTSARMDARLRTLQGEIEGAIDRNPATAELQDQYEAALRELADLQQQLTEVDEDDQEEVRAQLADVRQQLSTLQLVNGLESGRRDLAALLEEEDLLITRRNDLARRADEIAVDARLAGTGIELSSPAVEAAEVRTDVPRTAAVGLVLGALAAAGIAYALALRRRRFTAADEPESVLRARPVAQVPDFRREKIRGDLPVLTKPASASAEAFRFVAGAMRFDASVSDSKIFVVVSGESGDGKTVVAANAALAAASKGGRVLAVDADFGNQRLSMLLRVGEREILLAQPDRGLTDLDAFDRESLSRVVGRVTVMEGVEVDVLTQGSAPVAGPEFFTRAGIAELFAAIRNAYDLVVIDTPALPKVAYASEVARLSDRAFVVVSHRGSVTPVKDVADRLAVIGIPIVGYVYNKAPLTDDMARYEASRNRVLSEDR